jgi:hypothetical protein
MRKAAIDCSLFPDTSISCGVNGAGLGAIGADSTYACACERPLLERPTRRSTSQQYTDDLLIKGQNK